MPSSPTLIIFDCDGVLVDSEPLGTSVLIEAARELGSTMSLEEAILTFKGAKMADCITALEQRLGRPFPDDFVPTVRARTAEAFRRELQPIPGIRDVLAVIPHTICVASSGPREKIILALTVTGLFPYFEGRIFSSYDIDSWKPSPDLFLHAAKTLGFSPTSCVVVEDSALGVRAGIAAGMRVFAYTDPASRSEMQALGATPFLHMSELNPLLTRI